jgi:hypothetical protein
LDAIAAVEDVDVTVGGVDVDVPLKMLTLPVGALMLMSFLLLEHLQ